MPLAADDYWQTVGLWIFAYSLRDRYVAFDCLQPFSPAGIDRWQASLDWHLPAACCLHELLRPQSVLPDVVPWKPQVSAPPGVVPASPVAQRSPIVWLQHLL